MTRKEQLEAYLSENIDSIYRFAYTFTKDQGDAEDVVNESVIKALKALESLKKPEYMGTWFYRIVVNTAMTYLKKRSRVVYLDPKDMEELRDHGEPFSDLNFEEMIRRLDTKYKSIIVLRYFEGMALSDIAYVLNENLNTVKTRLYKALQLLRNEMEESL